MIKKIVILDLDGTVADCTHRLHFIQNGNRDYNGFYDNMDKDTPIWPIIDLVRALFNSDEYTILAVTGRPETHRRETGAWLIKHFVPVIHLFMRPAGDYRQDTIIKKEILEHIRKEFGEPEFAIDDRASVVKMWRDNGVRCLQVAPGDFDKPRNTYEPGKLILLVGPSGAGKSTYAQNYVFQTKGITGKTISLPWAPTEIISTDAIRSQLCGDFEDQSKNKQVFDAVYSIVEARVKSGLLTVVDATNIRNADRKALRDLVPLNTNIEYHVINRPLKEKLKTGGWRLAVNKDGVNLIERHDQTFNSNLKDILAGDNDPRVTVIDARKL